MMVKIALLFAAKTPGDFAQQPIFFPIAVSVSARGFVENDRRLLRWCEGNNVGAPFRFPLGRLEGLDDRRSLLKRVD
jgi:hypothetical protein